MRSRIAGTTVGRKGAREPEREPAGAGIHAGYLHRRATLSRVS